MFRHVAVIFSENLLNLWNVADCGQAFVCLNSMDDVVNDSTTVIASCHFLVSLELFLMNQRVAPLKQVDCFHFLVTIVDDFRHCLRMHIERHASNGCG